MKTFCQIITFFLVLLFLNTPVKTKASQLDEDHRNIESLNKGIFWDSPYNMSLSDTILFVTSSTTGISVISISDPDHPTRIAHYDPQETYAQASDLFLNFLFFTQMSSDQFYLRILFKNQYGYYIEHTFSKRYSTEIRKINAEFHLATVLYGDSLDLVYHSLGAGPDSVASTIITENSIQDFAIHDDYLFIADGAGGLKVYDRTDITSPVEIGSYTFSGEAKTIAYMNDLVLVGLDSPCVKVINVNDPENPVEISSIELDANPELIATDYPKTLIADINNRLYSINLSDQNTPIREGVFENQGDIKSIIPDEDTIYLLDDVNGLISVNVQSPLDPVQNWTFGKIGKISDAVITEETLFISDSHLGLNIYDISDPDNMMVLISRYGTPGEYYDLWYEEENIFLLNHQRGLEIIEVSDPANPSLVWSESEIAFGEKLVVKDNYVYILCNYYEEYSRVHIFDITDLTNPVMVSNFEIDEFLCHDLNVKDNFLFLISNGMLIYDIADLDNITEVSRTVGSNFEAVTNIDFYDHYAYLCNEENRAIILDLIDPLSPIQVDWDYYFSGYYVQVADYFAFLASRESGTYLRNLSNPRQPFIDGFYDNNFYANELTANNGKLFTHNAFYYQVMDYTSLLEVSPPPAFNLISPSNDTIITEEYISLNWEESQYINDEYEIWHAADSLFTENLDFDRSSRTYQLLFFEEQDTTIWWKIRALKAGTRGTFSNQTWKFHINNSNDISDEKNILPEEYQLINVYPNPFNPSLNIEVVLPEKGNMNLTVYNLLGKKVASLNNNQLDAGYHSFVFDGSHLSSGVYFLKASVPGKLETTRKVVLMK